jgi:hypothetical protein
MLLNLALLATDLDFWLSDAGLLRGGEAREMAGPLRPSLFFWVRSPIAVRAAMAALAAASVLFTLGWRTRVMGVVLYVGALSIHHRNLASASGADCLLVVMAFYLMLSPCGAAFSLDSRRRARERGTWAEPLIVPWAQRLIQIQISIVYFMAAFLKAGGPTWLDGTALYYVLNNLEYRRYTLGLLDHPLALNLLTTGTLVTELSLAFLLWSRPMRRWAALAGLALHGGIMLTINIPVFGELMCASYLTFLAPDELDALLRPLDPRRWLRRSAARAEVAGYRVDVPAAAAGPHRPGLTRPDRVAEAAGSDARGG